MKIFGGVFTAYVWPSIFTFLMLVVLIGLGTWQVERLHWKENLIVTIHDRMTAPPVDAAALLPDVSAYEYLPIETSGYFQNDKIMYLSAISLSGDGGYHVLVPLRLEGGRYLLVDRGWIPYARKDNAEFDKPDGFQTVKGTLRLPHHHWMQPVNRPDHGEWYGYDLSAMAAAAKVPELMPFVLEVDAAPNPSAYPIGGQTRVNLPNNHLGYAITWYGLALALAVIYGVSGWRRAKTPPKHR